MASFRCGSKLGRTVYVEHKLQLGTRWDDVLIGVMDTPALGGLVVLALNALAKTHPELVDRALKDIKMAPQGRENNDRDNLCAETDLLSLRSQPDQRSVEPDDTGRTVVSVNRDDRIYVVPENQRPVLAPPTDADLPVGELDPLGDSSDTGHT